MIEPSSTTTRPRNPFLLMVETYLDLINQQITIPSTELKRLFLFRSGVLDNEVVDIDGLVKTYEEQGLFPMNLTPFFNLTVSMNCLAYIRLLRTKIEDRYKWRVMDNISDLDTDIQRNDQRARRDVYLPSVQVIKDIRNYCRQRATFGKTDDFIGSSLAAVATRLLLELDRTELSSGVISKQGRADAEFLTMLAELSALAVASVEQNTAYLEELYPILRIFWAIGRLVFGDVDDKQYRNPVQSIDMFDDLRVSDATLAALPCPALEWLRMNRDPREPKISGRGCQYVAAFLSATTSV